MKKKRQGTDLWSWVVILILVAYAIGLMLFEGKQIQLESHDPIHAAAN